MQFAGRQAMGVAAGIGNGVLFKSTLVGTCAALHAGLDLCAPGRPGPAAHSGTVARRCRFPLMLAAIALFGIVRLGGGTCCGLVSISSSILSFAGAAFVGCALLAGHPPCRLQQFPAVAGAYLLAWLGGLVTLARRRWARRSRGATADPS